jgi:hypothetical protein
MQQALTTPLFKSCVLGLVLLSLGATVTALREDPVSRRLSLFAPEVPGDVYISAWRNGDILVTFEDDRLVPLTLKTRARVSDGCRWLAIEKIVPIDRGTFAYDYSEVILECDPGATPARKTPRTGYVLVR